MLTEGYYWTLTTREFGERFFEAHRANAEHRPGRRLFCDLTISQGGEGPGTKDADAVAKKLEELPVDDAFIANGHVQANGRMVSNGLSV